MSESSNGVWGDRIIRSLPYVILLLAIWRMASIHGDNAVDLAAGLQALFLALAAIFLKLDLRDRTAVQDRADDLADRSKTCHYVIPVKESDGPSDPAPDEPLPYKPPVSSTGAAFGAGGAFASGVPQQRSDATGGTDE
ncbi:membrane protein [Mycobacterium phage Phabba]|uniref:Membrane protein n=1 Tax=Mycobacterium phage Phabba TaxID=2027899 RepID=A0A249XSV6_9CAUD|nr:membrane protein [Mycobacterium phage Phabba]ASZ74811.1 membrane protein [Mycobacterium phage Phabba]